MGYQPIDSYGMIGDLRTIALVGTDASIDFMCFPHFDSPTIFAALLDDRKGGRFSIRPTREDYRSKQVYLPETNVLVTQFLSEVGIAEVTDFMPVDERLHAHRVIRKVTALKGTVEFDLTCDPRFDYGRGTHEAALEDGTVLFTPDAGIHPVRLRSTVPLEIDAGWATGRFTLTPGESAEFVLEVVYPGLASPAADDGYVDEALSATVDHWRRWIRRGSYPARWREMVVRSALTMKMLCSQSTGGIAAAATFALPEEIGGERNWDYRFTWIRDASLTAATLAGLGFTEEITAFVRWVEARYADGDEDGSLQIMYGIDGRKDLGEQTLDHLEGYMGSAPVRIGNGAYDQLQIDIYGELMVAIEAYDSAAEPISHQLWEDVVRSINWTANNWRRKDEGVWEVRGGQQEFLYSRLMSWVALDRGIRIAERRGRPGPVQNWVSARDDVYREVFDHFWNDEIQAFVQHRDSSTLDASCLLMPILGLVSPTDPQWLSTLDGIGDQLVDGSFVYRYRTEDAASDGLAGAEGTFTMCSFWYAECLARAGRLDEARLFVDKLLGFGNHLGLFSEELSPGGTSLGNYPQAFTHLGLVRAATFLDEALTASGIHH